VQRKEFKAGTVNRRNEKFTRIGLLVLAGALIGGADGYSARRQDAQDAPKVDNSRKNLPTEHRDAMRADQQGNSKEDVELTKKIRRSISMDKSLSSYAHNIKIITNNGVVYLKGPVKSHEEKDALGSKAAEIAGADQVKNDLVVKSS
jgi:hyperosmotically inducible protein